MKFRVAIAAFLIAVAVSSCGVARQSQSRDVNAQLMNISVGMDRAEVLKLLGPPFSREAYGNEEYLIYETNYFGQSEQERNTPILLRDGRVVGWGRNYYDNTKKSKIEADIKVETK